MKALIFGVTGQDGSYLSELLLSKGYAVVGFVRRTSTYNFQRIQHLIGLPNFKLVYGDLTDLMSIISVIKDTQPDEIYNLAAQTDVYLSFKIPVVTSQMTGLSAQYIFESVRILDLDTKIYQASSSEIFGDTPSPQSELTAKHPVSPYGIAKLFAHQQARFYATTYGTKIVSGVLFNHESPRRGERFVTKKITRGLIHAIKYRKPFYLGNLKAYRDWGYAPEFVEIMHKLVTQFGEGMFVVGTSERFTVQQFLYECIDYLDPIIKQEGISSDTLEKLIRYDEGLLRPQEVPDLRADTTKLRDLGVTPPQLGFNSLVPIMCDYELLRNDYPAIGDGIRVASQFSWTSNRMTYEPKIQRNDSLPFVIDNSTKLFFGESNGF